jgi:hypothetical protein
MGGSPARGRGRWGWSWRKWHDGNTGWSSNTPWRFTNLRSRRLWRPSPRLSRRILNQILREGLGGGVSRSTSRLTGGLSIEDKDLRQGRKSSAKTFNGFKEHFAVDLESTVTREVVRPANEPEHEAVELLAETLEQAPGLWQLDSDLGYMASQRIAQGAEQGVYIIARPRPHVGPLFTKQEFTLDFAALQVTCPGGQTVPLVPGKAAQFPVAACAMCPLRAQCTKATLGQGRSLHIREDAQFQQKLRTKMKTQRGRASLRKRTAVEHTIAHQLAHQGRRARYKGLRKNQCDGRRHAAGSNLQIAAHYEEEHRLAS